MPGELNPADLTTRAQSLADLKPGGKLHAFWFEGPSVYKLRNEEIGSRDFGKSSQDRSEFLSQFKPGRVEDSPVVVLNTVLEKAGKNIRKACGPSFSKEGDAGQYLLHKFSNLLTVLNIVAYILRWKTVGKSKLDGRRPTAEERDVALIRMVILDQKRSFPKEGPALREGKCVPKASQLSQLAPFLDGDGVIRMSPRFGLEDVTTQSRTPILLAKDSLLTERIIADLHLRLNHSGPGHVLFMLRHQYWVIGGLQSVKRVIARCVYCQKTHKKLHAQLMGNIHPALLPAGVHRDDTSIDPWRSILFDHSGTTYEIVNDVGEKVKIWLLFLFSGVTRFAKVFILTGLDAESIWTALQLHTSVAGMPEIILTDSFSSYHTVYRQYDSILQTLKSKCNQKGITFIANGPELDGKILNDKFRHEFSSPLAYSQVGAWESLVKILKKSIHAALKGGKAQSREALQVILNECATITNSRPLATELTGIQDVPVFVTPASLTLGYCPSLLPYLGQRKAPKQQVLVPLFQAQRQRDRTIRKFYQIFTDGYIFDRCKRKVWRRPNLILKWAR